MSGITKSQARIFSQQINRIYNGTYIPNVSQDNTISVGDILFSRKNDRPAVDSTIFSSGLLALADGQGMNRTITSSDSVSISTKLSGQIPVNDRFQLNEAGISVDFQSSNEMFLRVVGMKQQTLKDFPTFKKHILSKYVAKDISPQIFVVTSIIYAESYILQYSGKSGGAIAIALDGQVKDLDVSIKVKGSIKWQSNVGFFVEGLNGGVLGYDVQAIHLGNKPLSTEELQALTDDKRDELASLGSLNLKESSEIFIEEQFA